MRLSEKLQLFAACCLILFMLALAVIEPVKDGDGRIPNPKAVLVR